MTLRAEGCSVDSVDGEGTVEMLEQGKSNNVCKSRHQQFDAHTVFESHDDSPYLNASKI